MKKLMAQYKFSYHYLFAIIVTFINLVFIAPGLSETGSEAGEILSTIVLSVTTGCFVTMSWLFFAANKK